MLLARITRIAAALVVLGLVGSGAALAQRDKPGAFDYYTLVLSWSPTYCAEAGDRRNDPQCSRVPRERPYAFVLHGLWPQRERGRWPEDCRSADRGWVPGAVADRMLDIMPSRRLVFHEYRKHGTCTGLGVDGYFKLSRQLYGKVKIPPRFVRVTNDRMMVGVSELTDEFLAVNPGLKPDMLAIQCRGAGNRLREVRICFTKTGEFRACGRNESQRRLCSAERMYVPPVRVSASK